MRSLRNLVKLDSERGFSVLTLSQLDKLRGGIKDVNGSCPTVNVHNCGNCTCTNISCS